MPCEPDYEDLPKVAGPRCCPHFLNPSLRLGALLFLLRNCTYKPDTSSLSRVVLTMAG